MSLRLYHAQSVDDASPGPTPGSIQHIGSLLGNSTVATGGHDCADDLFDVIEFLYDHVSKPIETDGVYHSWGQCGWHYSKFERENGKKEADSYL